MKSWFKVSLVLFVVLAIVFPSMHVLAQDSTTTLPAVGAGDLYTFIAGFIPVKFQATIITVLTGLFLLEQFLASNTKIKANSTFQLIAGWVNTLYSIIKK